MMQQTKVTNWILFIFGLIMVFSLTACDSEDESPTPAPANAPITEKPVNDGDVEDVGEETAVSANSVQANPSPTSPLLISEILIGVDGDNNKEFIELYNSSSESINLEGYTLLYHLRADQEPQPLYVWDSTAEVPGLGHYLLIRAEANFGLMPDAVFETGLFGKGGLILQDANGEIVDLFGWGDAPDGSFAGSAAAEPAAGDALQRLPGGNDGNGINSGDNSADIIATAPNPQNSGSALTPLPDEQMIVEFVAPEVIEPGAIFTYAINVTNKTANLLSDVRVTIPLSENFTLLSEDGIEVGNGDELSANRYLLTIPQIDIDQTITLEIELQAPFTYFNTLVSGVKAEANGVISAFAEPQLIQVAGGSIPIQTARTLEGNIVTVEGVATMYTGGFFAGSTGTKFYLEDDSGGVQVYIPGGLGNVNIEVGDLVRVTGEIELYRDSIEVIPLDYAVDIEVLGSDEAPSAAFISTADNETNDAVIGQLNMIEGTATRIEEFTYSYEVDIIGADGTTTLGYIEKDTGVTTEPMDVGKQYQIIGISEFYSSKRQLKPRFQSDIAEIFPPVLLLSISGNNSAAPGDVVEYVITAVNHTAAPLTNLEIRTTLPQGDGTLAEIGNDGTQNNNRIVWTIDELAGDGSSVSVSYSVTVDADGESSIIAGQVTAVADQWPEPTVTDPFFTFVGAGGVPIWAIQGDGFKSPYVRSNATTQGIVTGVFPELNGFWLQESDSDDNRATSAGIFVLVDQFTIPVVQGDLAQVTGRVREISGQTTLYPTERDQIVVLSSENPRPAAETYDPPQDPTSALAYNESLEGMLVSVKETAVVIAPTTKYGAVVIIDEKWGVDTLLRTDEVGFTIFVDDGSSVTHNDQSTLPFAVAKGDLVAGLTGPLAFTFDNYKIAPTTLPEITVTGSELPTLPEAGSNQFSVATFNVENLFDTVDPHPSSPPRPLRGEYAQRLTKLADAIRAMGAPTIIGLQEVENIGVLEDLLELESLAEYGYEPYLIEGFDSRGIDQGYLVRSDRVTVEGVESYNAPDGLTSRPPLVISATIHLDSGDQSVILLNNHFTSLSAGEEATEPRRTAQAAWNVTIMEELAANNPDAMFIVLGDLNSFYQTLPIDTLQEAGLRHAYEFFDEGETLPYTYIFQGRTQSLDHLLMSDALFDRLIEVQALHIDADYPLASPDDTSARRISDHDPLLLLFSWD